MSAPFKVDPDLLARFEAALCPHGGPVTLDPCEEAVLLAATTVSEAEADAIFRVAVERNVGIVENLDAVRADFSDILDELIDRRAVQILNGYFGVLR